jgi:hypothetical protein
VIDQQPERALDNVWRERVLDAEKIYRLSKARLDIAIQDLEQIGDPHDFMQAQDAHERAIAKYMRTLCIFHQLVVNGERPTES